MIEPQSDQSDHEGFVPNQIRIDSHDKHQQFPQKNIPNKFQPRYIAGQGVIKKLPNQCHEIGNIPVYPPSKNEPQVGQKCTKTPSSAYELYNNANQYSLVYSRYKQSFGTDTRSAFNHQINLKCCENYKQENFRNLRQFEQTSYSSERGQSSITFDSHFQGGNLLCAYLSKKQPNTYTLFMHNDTNTYGYNQWFYFAIKNVKSNVKYTFKIANYKKSYSFFKEGLRPLVFSLLKAKKNGNGWYRDGQNINYYQSPYTQPQCTTYYTLQFTLEFQHNNDFVTLSPNVPYSYSKLIHSLHRFELKALENQLTWKMKSISRSLASNQVPYISLTQKTSNLSLKPSIVILARQHSGETWSSFMVQQIMNELVEQKSPESKWLLKNYVIRIFPMINVDGVIYGNFRCDLAGYDLNRCWKNPIPTVHPQIFNIKKQLKRLNDKRDIELCLDFHTHSKDLGAFAYCCVQSQKCREFPMLLSKVTSIFRYQACTFGITPQKQYTARASVYNITNNYNTVTIQLSAFGFKRNKIQKAILFTPQIIKHISKSILYAFHCYSIKVKPIKMKMNIEGIIQEQQKNQNDQIQYQDPISGSDSNPEIDEIEMDVRIQKIFPKKFIEDILEIEDKNVKKLAAKVKKTIRKKYISQQKYKTIKVKSIPEPKSVINKTQTKIVNVMADSVEYLPKQESFNIKKELLLPNSEQPLYKKQKTDKLHAESSKLQIEKPTKQLNLIQFSLKKLPIVPPDKSQPNVNSFIEQAYPIVGGISYMKRDQSRFDKTYTAYEAMCRPRVRINSKKLVKQTSRLEQQLPFLCIMSQSKKKSQMEMFNKKQDLIQNKQTKFFHNSILNSHKQKKSILNKFKQSQKNPIQILSKISHDFTRYGQSYYGKKSKN